MLCSLVLDRAWQGSAGCPHMCLAKGRVILFLLLCCEVAGDGCEGWIFLNFFFFLADPASQ